MKVFYVANQYDYGYPSWGDSYENAHWFDTFANMKGIDLEIFDYYQVMKKSSKDSMSQQLVDVAEKFKPDFLFANFMTLDTDPNFKSIEKITNSGCNTFFWSSDDRMRYHSYARLWAPYFRWMGTMYTPAVQWYNRDGFGNKVIRTEYAANHFNFKPKEVRKDIEVSFIGQGGAHSNRRQIVDTIKNAGIDIKLFGRGWTDGNGKLETTEEYVNIINRSKININLNMSSDNTSSQINGRFFEIPMCRGFMITGNTEDNSKKYLNDKETVYYGDVQQLINHIKHFLNNPDQREEISQKGYVRMLEEHTYEKRFLDIFKKIGLKYGI